MKSLVDILEKIESHVISEKIDSSVLLIDYIRTFDSFTRAKLLLVNSNSALTFLDDYLSVKIKDHDLESDFVISFCLLLLIDSNFIEQALNHSRAIMALPSLNRAATLAFSFALREALYGN